MPKSRTKKPHPGSFAVGPGGGLLVVMDGGGDLSNWIGIPVDRSNWMHPLSDYTIPLNLQGDGYANLWLAASKLVAAACGWGPNPATQTFAARTIHRVLPDQFLTTRAAVCRLIRLADPMVKPESLLTRCEHDDAAVLQATALVQSVLNDLL
jgi:hypothetical protein